MVAKANCLEFENKKPIEALKAERKKRNRGKKLNLLGEEDDGLQLFSLSRVQATLNFMHDIKVGKKQQKKVVKERKIE